MEDFGVRPHAAHNAMSLVKAVLTCAAQIPEVPIDQNPMIGGGVEMPSAARLSEIYPVPPAVLEAVRRHVTTAHAMPIEASRLFLAIGQMTGMGPGEIRAIHTDSVLNHTIRVGSALGLPARREGPISPRKEVKNKKRRIVPLPPLLAEDLATYELARDGVLFPRLQSESNWRN